MEYGYNSDNEELSMEEEYEPRRGGIIRKKMKNAKNNDDSQFKSKNLGAERRRRAKLNDRLLQLRTLVPIITNMTKANIIKDAITYIEELKREVEELSDDLLGLEEIDHNHHDKTEEIKPIRDHENNTTQEMKNSGIEPEVKVVPIDDKRLWLKVVFPNKLGGLTKLIEAINNFGFDFNDTNLTTTKGAAILTSCLEGRCDGSLEVEQVKELMLNVIINMY